MSPEAFKEALLEYETSLDEEKSDYIKNAGYESISRKTDEPIKGETTPNSDKGWVDLLKLAWPQVIDYFVRLLHPFSRD
jgi:hypothetical protein